MNADLAAFGMNPDAATVGWNRNVGRTGDERATAAIDRGEQFADMRVQLALRPAVEAIDGDGPIVAPDFLRLGDGRSPVCGAIGSRHVVQGVMQGVRDGEQAVGLLRV